MDIDNVRKNLPSQPSASDQLLAEALAFVDDALASDDLVAASSGLMTIASIAVLMERHGVASQAYRAKHYLELGRARSEVDYAIGALLFEVHAARWREKAKEPPSSSIEK